MKRYSHLLAVTLLVVLTACRTTVVTEEDRALPTPAEPPAPAPVVEVEPTEVIEVPADVNEVPADANEAPTDVVEVEADSMTVQSANLSESFIAFTGSKGELVSHEGKFNDFAVSLSRDADNTPVKVMTTIEIGSMETDSAGLTSHLLNDDFFGEPTYPQASFTSTSITGTGDDSYTVVGDLTIKDVTQAIEFPATITDLYLTATLTIDRLAFGVGEAGQVDVEVPLEIKVVFQ